MLNWEELKIGVNYKKEGLITSVLKSESRNAERNDMKYFNNVDNNNADNNANDETYDSKIMDKISDIRAIVGWGI